MKTKNSIFSNAVKVIYLQEDDEEYSKLSKMFKIHGYAFIANSYIFVDIPSLKRDGWLKKEYLQFIESHEISHKILKHKDGKRSAVQEAEADYLGVRLCQDKGFRSEIQSASSISKTEIEFHLKNTMKNLEKRL